MSKISRTQEKLTTTMSGLLMLLVGFLLFVASIMLFFNGAQNDNVFEIIFAVLVFTASVFGLGGLYSLQPNEAMALTMFGQYKGTDRNEGLRWVLPWITRKKISLRVRNITSDTLKVNDKDGNPIEIAANVVWRVKDSAQALFDVDNYESFCRIEIDTALRDIAAHYSYDHAAEGELTLRGHAEEVAELLGERLNARLDVGGMMVDEARISHLAYAQEIAGAMLKRQQAQAVLAARALIVNGAVGMVEQALVQLSERGVVELDEERKAQMVANLLVVLCSDKDAQPVLNTGTIY
ncbi:MAG: SPFH domain-containing protein [Caulobacterales bacterium]|nr:SPFH domain-containing protein [Caulobacterales bacterium]MCA0373710.1 SPFH domain-containing protein [Pseudomonadota bacterium]